MRLSKTQERRLDFMVTALALILVFVGSLLIAALEMR